MYPTYCWSHFLLLASFRVWNVSMQIALRIVAAVSKNIYQNHAFIIPKNRNHKGLRCSVCLWLFGQSEWVWLHSIDCLLSSGSYTYSHDSTPVTTRFETKLSSWVSNITRSCISTRFCFKSSVSCLGNPLCAGFIVPRFHTNSLDWSIGHVHFVCTFLGWWCGSLLRSFHQLCFGFINTTAAPFLINRNLTTQKYSFNQEVDFTLPTTWITVLVTDNWPR